MNPDSDFELYRNRFGRLVLVQDGQTYEPVIPVRNFPISARAGAISLIGPDGSERVWLDSLDELPQPIRTLINDELASREFIPEIQRIHTVSSFATPSRWTVETNRGDTELVLKSEDDIRRLKPTMLLIVDINAVQFLIRDTLLLDKESRRLLDRFL